MVDRNDIFTSPQRDLAMVASILKDLKAADVSAQLRALFDGSGPLAFVGSPTPIAGADAELLAALQAAESAPVLVAAASAEQVWPYTSFGATGKVAERKLVADLELTTVRFANGARLNVRPTKYSADQILVNVAIGNGRLDLPRDRPNLIV